MKILDRSILTIVALFLLLAVPGLPLPVTPVEADMDNYVYLPFLATPKLNAKKGAFITYSACQDVSALRASWYLSNGVQPPAGCPQPDPRFVPVIHNAGSMAQLSTAISQAQVSGWLKGFIEPNLAWQGNVSPAQAAVFWRQIEIEADAVGGIKLVSPSPSQHDPGWLWRMVVEYRARYGGQPRFDAIGWNYYHREPEQTQAYLRTRRQDALANNYNVPVWVIEYAGECWNNGTGNQAIMNSVTPWFGETAWISRYAWFANRIVGTEPWGPGWQSCSLVNPSTGALNPLGQLYAAY
jgi:hypothetical protein